MKEFDSSYITAVYLDELEASVLFSKAALWHKPPPVLTE